MTKYKPTYKLFILGLTVFVSLSVFGQGQISLKHPDLTKLPRGIQYEGKIKTAVRWTDKLGDNIVITTETGEKTSKKEEPSDGFKEAAIYAYHYIAGKDSAFLRLTRILFSDACGQKNKHSAY